jgi:hypothetical protein
MSITGILYCFRFGYIWTAYGHGGQLLGIPFSILLIGLTVAFFLSNNPNSKRKLFNFSFLYFFSLAGFSSIIELIRIKVDNYFEFLYYEPEGWVNKIFLGWIIIGITTYFWIEYNYKRKMNK